MNGADRAKVVRKIDSNQSLHKRTQRQFVDLQLKTSVGIFERNEKLRREYLREDVRRQS